MLSRTRKNGQVTIPAKIRKAARLEEGDMVDIAFSDGRIVLTPKKLIDNDQAWFWTEEWQAGEKEAQGQIDRGELVGLDNVEDLIAELNKADE